MAVHRATLVASPSAFKHGFCFSSVLGGLAKLLGSVLQRCVGF